MSGIPLVGRQDGVYLATTHTHRLKTPTHIAFSLAEAEALIDPNDPAVRERIAQLAEDIDPVHPVAIFDAVLAALRSKP